MKLYTQTENHLFTHPLHREIKVLFLFFMTKWYISAESIAYFVLGPVQILLTRQNLTITLAKLG